MWWVQEIWVTNDAYEPQISCILNTAAAHCFHSLIYTHVHTIGGFFEEEWTSVYSVSSCGSWTSLSTIHQTLPVTALLLKYIL